jgi:short-subunit dehydrogenase
VVRAALAALERGGGTVVPGLMNEAGVVAQRLTPRRLVTKLTARIFDPE